LAEDGNIEMAVNRLLIIQDESKLIEALCLILLILWNLDSLNVKDKQLYTKSIFDTIQSKCPTSDAESTLSQREIDDLLGGNEFLELGNIPLLCLFNTPYFIPNNEILKDRISRISDSNLIGFLILTRNNLNVLNSFLEKQREINTIYNYLCEYSYKHMDQESYINIMSIIFQNIDCLKWDNQKIEAYIDLYNSLILNNRKSLIETNIEKFENLLFKIDNSFEKIELLIKLANFYLELKNNFKSKEIVNTAKINILNTKINEKEKKVNNLIDVSKLYLKLDEKENAVKTLNEAEKIVIENIKDTNGDNEKYLLLISEVYFNLENKQKSFQIQNLILDTYNKISQVKKKNTITLYLFKSLMNTFRKEEAKNILNSIVINQSDAIQSINIILNECINHDEMDFIKIFSKSFRNSNYETRNLVTLGEALIKNNIFLLGDEIFDIVINNKLKIEESNFSIEACYDIIFTYLNNNYNIEKAKKYFEVIKQNDFIYNKNTKTNLRLAIMFGNDIEAIELAKKMYSSKNEITQNDFYDSYLDISTDKLKNIKNRKSLIEFGEGLIVNLDKTHPSNKDNKSIFYYRIIEAFLKKKAYKKSREILTELSKKTYYHDLFKFVKDEKIILFLVKFNISLIELDNLDSNDLKNYTFIVIKLLKSSINKKFINKSMKKLDPKLVFEYNEKYSNENIERINFSLRSISKIKYPKRRLELYYSLLRNSTIKIKNSNIVKIYEGCLNAIESLSDDNNKVESLRLLVIIFHDYNKSNYVTFLLDILKTTIEDNEGNGGYDYMEYYIDALSATIGEDEAWNYLESKAKIFLDYYNLKNCRMIIFNSLLEKSQYGKVENYLLLINNEKLKLDLSINLILNELENKNKNFNINFIMKLLQEAEKLMNNYYEDDIIDHKSNLAKIYNKINNSDQCIKTYLFIINELLYSKAQGSKSFYLENLSKEIVRTGNPNIWNIWEENRENINIFTYDQKNILISSYLKEFSYLDNYESLPLLSYLLRALLLLPESDYFLNIKLTLIFKIIIIVDPMKSLTLFENISNFIE
jgi:hypothetical protein